MMIRVTCKFCGLKGHGPDFKDGCPNEECMSRRRGRNNKPAALLRPVTHNRNCICDRCLDADAKMFEEQLEDAWEKHNKEAAVIPNIRLVVRDSPVIGPFDGEDFGNAVYVECPMAVCGNIYPVGKRRK